MIVDTVERPDLAQRIRDDIIHCCPCPQCATVMAFGMPLLVYRPGASVPVFYSPVTGASEEQQEEHGDMLMHLLYQRLGADWDDRLAKGVYHAPRENLHYLIDCNPDLLPGGRDPSLRGPMTDFLLSANWEEARSLIEQHPVLLSREAQVFLRTRMDRAKAAGDMNDYWFLGRHLEVLERCGSEGIPATFAQTTGFTGGKWM